VRFHVEAWSPGASRVLVNGLSRVPELRINGRKMALAPPHEYQPEAGRLVIELGQPATVELRFAVGQGRL
jgi:hypothetical protein